MGCSVLRVLGLILLNGLLCYAQDPILTIEPNWSTLFSGESVTFICDMRFGEDVNWYYSILKDGQEFLRLNQNKNYTLLPLATGDSGEYQCCGTYRQTPYFTRDTNKVSLTVSGTDVILQSPASVLYVGESVSLRCRHRTQRKTKGASFYKNRSLIGPMMSGNTSTITFQPQLDRGSYTCKFAEGEESKPIQLQLQSYRPKAYLRKDKTNVPVGGNVTLTCSVFGPSSGWRYFWYRGRKTHEPMTTQDVVFLSNEEISISQGGVYWCRGGRGNPVYYTQYSDPIVTSRAEVNLQTSWPELYYGETLTLTCDIAEGEDTEWEYEWSLSSSGYSRTEYMIRYAPLSLREDYRCKGRVKGGGLSTEWSDAFIVTLSNNKPEPVLSVSPSWLFSLDSVTLTCRVKDPSAGWRFYWYKVVLKPPNSSYGYKLLPGSINGTKQDSYVVPAQERTLRYGCRAGRGNPVVYTEYSELKFAWSGDIDSEASLRVSPDRSQHFIQESVSLSCDGNSTEWRVNRLSTSGYLSQCLYWGKMSGSICNIHKSENIDGVYWCESGTGLFSNAVNLTRQNSNIIVMSPVHPVPERDSVTLGCKLRTENVLTDVHFYKNGKLIQNDTRKELRIAAVSKSDEGFYKCEGKVSPNGLQSQTSSESWMSVKSMPASPVPVLLIVGLVFGVLLILLLLLLLYHYRMSKESCFIRSKSTNQGSATDHMTNQDETPCEDNSPLQDISSDVTYSSVVLNNIRKNENKEPEESIIYLNVKMGSAAEKSSPADVNETLYCEVKAGKALDQ